MNILEFLFYCNYLSIFFILFLLTFCLTAKNFPAKLNRFFIISIIPLILLIITDSINNYYRTFNEVHYIRIVAATLGYMIRPVCAAIFLLMFIKDSKKCRITIAAVLLVNAVIVAFNLKFPVVFYFDQMNRTHRAALWFVPYISSFGFLIGVVVYGSMQFRQDRRKAIFSYAMTISVIIAALVEAFDLARFTLPAAGIICVFFYYLYMNNDLYKRDTLTGLYKRSSFDNDLNKFRRSSMVILTMDLNDLKNWNDKYGHSEGDRALISAVTAMKGYFKKSGVIYRTGGDEFVALCPKKNLADMDDNIQAFKEDMKNSKYKVAIGAAEYKKGDVLDDVLKLSDRLMYENKMELKKAYRFE